jgi:hypothetical protein
MKKPAKKSTADTNMRMAFWCGDKWPNTQSINRAAERILSKIKTRKWANDYGNEDLSFAPSIASC